MIFNDTAVDDVMRQWQRTCGENLALYRRDRKHTQVTLAVRSGVSQATISRIEVGLMSCSDAIKHRLAVALNCEVQDIWPVMSSDLFRAATTQGAGRKASDIGVRVA